MSEILNDGINVMVTDSETSTVVSILPVRGAEQGGTTVVIMGTGFVDVEDVAFDNESAASFEVDSATQITAVTPPHKVGPSDVRVIFTDGENTKEAVLEEGYAFGTWPVDEEGEGE